MSTTTEFIQRRIDKAKEQLIAIEDAHFAIATGAIETYTVDTGQSRTTVTKANLSVLDKLIDSLLNRIITLEARIGKGGSVIVGRPGW